VASSPDAAAGDCEEILGVAVRAMGRFPGHVTTATAPSRSTDETIAAIVNVATNVGADLIIVGSRGLSKIARFFLGSVAAGVARTSTCPVLIARAPVGSPQTAIIGIDGSVPSQGALEWVTREMPLPPDCEMILVQVANAGAIPVAAPQLERIDSALRAEPFPPQESRESTYRGGEQAAVAIRSEAGRPATFLMREGDPAKEIIALATERNADLIVTGSRGLTKTDAHLVGSVSEYLLQHAPCSVLIVKDTHHT